jgi:glycosyltransferase involved in cell wall biosynthesis
MTTPKVYFFQSTPNLAGAQKSLSRLLVNASLQAYEPTVFISSPGWFSRFCEENRIRHHILAAPGPRKLGSRLLGNQRYADRIAAIIRSEAGERRVILHGNDLLEGTPVVNVARRLGAASILTLRTPGMSRRDFEKYHCDRVDLIAAVGRELFLRIEGWSPPVPVRLVPNGLADSEFFPLKLNPRKKPERIVVLGASQPRKGWSDLLQALELLDPEALGIRPEFSFLGADYGVHMEAFFREYHPSGRFVCRHLPRTPDFVETLRRHDMAIQPSRSESFGMAALEAIAAGIPLMSTRTGYVDVVMERRWLAEPEDSPSLAAVFSALVGHWEEFTQDCRPTQERVRQTVNIRETATAYSRMYQTLADHAVIAS